MLRFIAHYGIHFLVPIAIAFLFFREKKLKILLLLWAGILLDIDHVVAEPIFDPNRCSINFHPLHSYWAIAVYLGLLFFNKTRVLGIAFVLHMVADSMDCWFIGP
ncbi:MAG: DUF6122 family protein [Bacteroidota bacterium]